MRGKRHESELGLGEGRERAIALKRLGNVGEVVLDDARAPELAVLGPHCMKLGGRAL